MHRFASLSLAQKLKDTAGMLDAFKMVLFDVFVHMPIMYFPSYYTIKEVSESTEILQGHSLTILTKKSFNVSSSHVLETLTIQQVVTSGSWNPVYWAHNGLMKYYGNFQEDFVAMAKLWGPSDCVQFGECQSHINKNKLIVESFDLQYISLAVLPLHIRMPFRHCVSFFWTAYVSFTRGAVEEKKEE